ncbi:hypothetical protein F7725_002514 [Dissostichus mawsoni]|uniref:EF-hand domain-containing family member C2 n=1 Tax=Dissostichus mawsoni TaxID=36200 RepID=A0A7J5Y2K5_DISMA|nr:hypothetical protein F7725_002514 [Dissostichus mawsoni]
MALPFLPGNSRNRQQLGKDRFHKSQHFDYSNGVPLLMGTEKPGIGGELLLGQEIKTKFSVYPKGEGSDLPAWVAFDKQALCFEAFCKEAETQARDETYRIRKFKIFFFLEDDTMQVVEPENKNSGIPHDDDQFYNIFHFNLNQQMVLYARTFTVTNCDSFTRNFLTKLGRRDTLKQFLDHDREVLCFSCFWDDSESVFGDPHQLILHYYLSDDTVEILETITPNSGRDNPAKFLHRSKLPRHSAMMKQPGQMTDRTVLNTGAVQDDCYEDSDLRVGGEVNVWGRREFTPLQYKGPVAPKPPRPVPPYNGFGSEEDSLSSCQGLLPKPPQKDFRKFMDKDRCGLESNILNFRAKTVTSDPVDRERVFVISFYLSDDSISVFERAQKNSGRVKKPGQKLFKSQPSEYFTPQDLYVGATLVLNDKPFKLLDADEYTLNYMEKHAEEFPKANVGNILSKLRSIGEEKRSEIRKFLALSDPSKTGFIPYESFRGLMSGLDCVLSDHEVLVLARCFSQSEQQEADVGRGVSPLKRFADGDQIDFHAFLTGIDWVENAAPRVMPDDILKKVNYSSLLNQVFGFIVNNNADPTTTAAS